MTNTSPDKELETTPKATANQPNQVQATFLNNQGARYLLGQDGESDPIKAAECFRQAISMGSVAAMNNLAHLLLHGKGIPQDIPQALHLFERAAALGNEYALTQLGLMYRDGIGVKQDLEKAQSLLTQAQQIKHRQQS